MNTKATTTVAIALGAVMNVWAASASAQTVPPPTVQSTTSTTRTQPFEVISVVGNRLVVRSGDATREYTVPEDFRFTVDGKQIGVRDLKVGMKGEATITTLTTVRPVFVTEERSAKVMQAFGNSVILRSQDGKFRLFTQEDADRYGIGIIKNGQPIEFQQLRANDEISAIFVTPREQVLTQEQVDARLALGGTPTGSATTGAAATSTRPAPATATRSIPPPPPPPTSVTSAPAPREGRSLPKTASPLPMIALAGLALLAVGLTMTIARRRAA